MSTPQDHHAAASGREENEMTDIVPPLGPDPTLLSRKEVDALYETLSVLQQALDELGVDYIVTGGSLLGAFRQHSILFCDDDIDIAVIGDIDRVRQELKLPDGYSYRVLPWEGGDRVRHARVTSVFVDVFSLRSYTNFEQLKEVIGIKAGGQPQPDEYVQKLVDKIAISPPFWHFATRKAIELWPKEVYRPFELFPLQTLKFGPLSVRGPQMPIRLLKRAFGDDCFDVYYPSASHQTTPDSSHHCTDNTEMLQPLVHAGGTWETARKIPLEDHHFLPMQPTKRAERRLTMHNRQQLEEYLQTSREEFTVYSDGVFDLFHVGHAKSIQECAKLGTRVILGVTGDEDATSYKRRPVIPQEERVAIVQAIQGVDKVICPCPLVVTQEFMEEHSIDLVVHGFLDEADAERQREFFAEPMRLQKFQRIPYFGGQSTTRILDRIRRSDQTHQWFGTTVASVTNRAQKLPYDPMPLELRTAMEPHIRKAAQKRDDALKKFPREQLAALRAAFPRDVDIDFDCGLSDLRRSFLDSCGDCELMRIHETPCLKAKLLQQLTRDWSAFHESFDRFVRTVCAPWLGERFGCDAIHYQSFPCIRMIQPDEFSIGPHADVAYGHHPCSINFYVPLTRIDGTASLFLESRPGSEDWHPIEGDFGTIKVFCGGICTHWTTDNTTDYTRVSLDFRMIPDSLWEGPDNVYKKPGYFAICHRAGGEWQRAEPLAPPDGRCGFPWTVKDWSKLVPQ